MVALLLDYDDLGRPFGDTFRRQPGSWQGSKEAQNSSIARSTNPRTAPVRSRTAKGHEESSRRPSGCRRLRTTKWDIGQPYDAGRSRIRATSTPARTRVRHSPVIKLLANSVPRPLAKCRNTPSGEPKFSAKLCDNPERRPTPALGTSPVLQLRIRTEKSPED